MGMLLYRHLHLRDGTAEAARLEAVKAEDERRQAAAVAAAQAAEAASPVVDAPAEGAPVEVVPEFVPTVEWLRSLDESALRAQAAGLGIEVDGRWGIGRIRREVADKLGLEF